MRKKILTLNDLISFCKSGNITNFSSSDSGYNLAVQTLAIFEEDKGIESNDIEDTDNSILFGTIKVFHTGKNRNGSYVSHESAMKAMKTMAYKPILAYIHNFGDDSDEDYDFTSHEIEIKDDGEFEYIESQVGSFTSDTPYFVKNLDEDGIDFVCARAAIPRAYSRAADIIEHKNGTKVSVELSINCMEWNSDENVLILKDFSVSGCTLLGRSIDNYDFGSTVEEGMQGAKFVIDDFKEDNNSIVRFSNSENSKLIEILEKINTTLSNLSINNSLRKEDGSMEDTNKFEQKDAAEIEITQDGITITAPIQENENASVFEIVENNDTPDSDDNNDFKGENMENQNIDDNFAAENVEDQGNGESNDTNISNEQAAENKYTMEFKLSFNDIETKIYRILKDTYEDTDNDIYCWMSVVFDDYFVYEILNNEYHTFYKQKYSVIDDEVEFVGVSEEVFPSFLTKAEKDALELMQARYSSMETELSNYKLAEINAQKMMKVVNNSDYSDIKHTEDFKSLVNDMGKYSVDELVDKADILLAKHFKLNKKNNEEPATDTSSVLMFSSFADNSNENNAPYGGIFNDYFKKNKR